MKAFCAMIFAVALCNLGVVLRAELANGIQAIVHDSVITSLEVEMRTAAVQDELRRQYRTQPEVYNKKLTEAYNDSLEQLLEHRLILHEFTAAGYGVPETVIDEYVEERIRG